MHIIENMVYLLGSLFTTTASLVAQKPIYDKEFVDKFSDPKDRAELDKAITEMKSKNDRQPKTITLKNNQEITIVVS